MRTVRPQVTARDLPECQVRHPIDWPNDGWTDTFAVGEEEAAEIAAQLELRAAPSDMSLKVNFDLNAGGKELVIKLNLTGTVTQTCVVTLEPIETKIEESFLRRFRDQAFFAGDAKCELRVADELVIQVGGGR